LGFRAYEELLSKQSGFQWLRDLAELFQKQNVNWSYSDYRDEDFGISDNPEAKAVLSSSHKNESGSTQAHKEDGVVRTHDGYRLFCRRDRDWPRCCSCSDLQEGIPPHFAMCSPHASP